MTIFYFILVFLSAFFDRLQGDKRGFGSIPEAAVMGLCLALIASSLTYSHWVWAVAACWAAGSTPGLSFTGGILRGEKYYYGDKVERWQVTKLLKQNLWVAAIVRGLIWGLPCAILSSWYTPAIYLTIAVVIAFPLSLLLTRWFIDDTELLYKDIVIASGRWGKSQLVRGGMCAVFVWMLIP